MHTIQVEIQEVFLYLRQKHRVTLKFVFYKCSIRLIFNNDSIQESIFPNSRSEISSNDNSHQRSSKSLEICSALKRILITFAGLPPTIEYGAIFLVTTEFAAIIAP